MRCHPRLSLPAKSYRRFAAGDEKVFFEACLLTPPTGYQAPPGNPMSFRLCLIFRAIPKCLNGVINEAEPARHLGVAKQLVSESAGTR
jgi:hypothetical protein